MQTDRLSLLLQSPQKLFHTTDLALLWQCTNKNTLYTAIRRYVARKILFPVHKGFYSVVPLGDLDPLTIGVACLHRFAYISTETVLVRSGIIAQNIEPVTLVSDLSRRFVVGDNTYLCRQLQPQFLHNSAGISQDQDYLIATPARAVADLLYFNPVYYFDNRAILDWSEVANIQREVGYL